MRVLVRLLTSSTPVVEVLCNASGVVRGKLLSSSLPLVSPSGSSSEPVKSVL